MLYISKESFTKSSFQPFKALHPAQYLAHCGHRCDYSSWVLKLSKNQSIQNRGRHWGYNTYLEDFVENMGFELGLEGSERRF